MPLQREKFDHPPYLGHVDLTKTQAPQVAAAPPIDHVRTPGSPHTLAWTGQTFVRDLGAQPGCRGGRFLESDTLSSNRVSNSKNAESGPLEMRKPRE